MRMILSPYLTYTLREDVMTGARRTNFVAYAPLIARQTGLTLREVLDEHELTAQGYGGLMAVGGGSARPPRLVRLSYRPRGARSA